MRKLLNVLYVTTPDSYLARDGQNVLVLVDNEVRFRVPIHNLEGIVHFGYTGASPALMAFCAENNVALTFCTEHGRFLARVTGQVSGNVLVRRKQYRMADDAEESSYVARSVIVGKLANSRTVLQRALRDHPDRLQGKGVDSAVKQVARIIEEAVDADSMDKLRGAEGEGARLYFNCLDHLILDNKKIFYMHKRSRRPPRDPFNALLSFLYTMLANDVVAALETVGLDPAVGFLHRDRPGRASLALDLMEELRPYLADRLALSLINRKQVMPKGFVVRESGAVHMDDETRRTVLQAWQERKRDVVTHPFLEEKIEVGLLPYVQAMLFARYVRGDIDGYPPFLAK